MAAGPHPGCSGLVASPRDQRVPPVRRDGHAPSPGKASVAVTGDNTGTRLQLLQPRLGCV